MSGGRLGGKKIEQNGKRTHGHGKQHVDYRGEGSIRGQKMVMEEK